MYSFIGKEPLIAIFNRGTTVLRARPVRLNGSSDIISSLAIANPESPSYIGTDVTAECKDVIRLVFDDVRSIDAMRQVLNECQEIIEHETKERLMRACS